jgi:dihydroflavonol-4-reductase
MSAVETSRVLVTGGAGFIGSHLVQLLMARGEQVRVFDRNAAGREHLPSNIEYITGDIRDRVQVFHAVTGCARVYHLAANPQLWTWQKGHFDQVNYVGTRNVLHSALEVGVERVLHCSTESILTRAQQTTPIKEDQQVPIADVIGPYCRSKWKAEALAFQLAQQGAPILIVNPTLPIGPGDWGRSPPTQMILDCALGKRSFYVDAEFNLIDVRDVAAGMIAAMDRGQPGRRYLLGAENWTIHRLFAHVAKLVGVAGPKFAVPYPIALTTAVMSEWFADVFTQRIPAATVTGVRLTRRRMHFDAAKSLTELHIEPRAIADSISNLLHWMVAVGWLTLPNSRLCQ